VTVAMAADPVVIRTHALAYLSWCSCVGLLLTRLGPTCMLTEYRRSTDKPNENGVRSLIIASFVVTRRQRDLTEKTQAAGRTLTR